MTNTDPGRAPGAPAAGGAAINVDVLYRQMVKVREALGGTVRLRWRVGPAMLRWLQLEEERYRSVFDLGLHTVAAVPRPRLFGEPVVLDTSRPRQALLLEALVNGRWVLPDFGPTWPGDGLTMIVAEPLGTVALRAVVSRALLNDAEALRAHIEGVARSLAAERYDDPLMRLKGWQEEPGHPSYIGLDPTQETLIAARVDVL
jgi:hypothetical protein